MPESYELFKLALKNNNYNPYYINENGKLYESIHSLNNNQLIKNIRSRIKAETPKINDCKVLVLNSNSSISKAIEQSHELSRFLTDNINKLKINSL